MYFDLGPLARAATQPPSGTATVPSKTICNGSVAVTVSTISPLTRISSESSGAIDTTSAFTRSVGGAPAASVISSPGSRPSTCSMRIGPVEKNVRPRLIASTQLCWLSGPVTCANVRSEPGGGSIEHVREVVGAAGRGHAEARVQKTVVEVGRAALVRVERADVVVVAEAERDVERDERPRGVGRRRAARTCTGA